MISLRTWWNTSVRQAGWSVKAAWIFLLITGFLAVAGPLISNEKPYRCVLDGQVYYPLFSGLSEAALSARHPAHSPVDWHTTSFSQIWRAPIPYSYHTLDLGAGTYQPPGTTGGQAGSQRHWLGTDGLGRDVLSGMIRGCRVSLLIGFGAMLLAMCVGVPLGAAGAYAGNRGLRLHPAQAIVVCVTIGLLVIIASLPGGMGWKIGFGLALLLPAGWLFRRIGRWRRIGMPIPLDRIILGVISVIDGFPGLFLTLIILAMLPVKGWAAVMAVIALLRWPAMARYMRAEVLKMKEAHYIQAVQLLNLPDRQILVSHIIPFALRPVMISFIFGVASAIVAESSLSFLGIGMSADELNWGRLLAQSRHHFDAWWLVVFPGAAISMTLIALYTIGEAWEKRLERRDE